MQLRTGLNLRFLLGMKVELKTNRNKFNQVFLNLDLKNLLFLVSCDVSVFGKCGILLLFLIEVSMKFLV